jgi:hypothetical protein
VWRTASSIAARSVAGSVADGDDGDAADDEGVPDGDVDDGVGAGLDEQDTRTSESAAIVAAPATLLICHPREAGARDPRAGTQPRDPGPGT